MRERRNAEIEQWRAAAECATALAERYAEAIEQISAALDGPAPVNHVRAVIARLEIS